MADREAQINVKIDPDVYDRVRLKALQEKWSITGLIRECCALYLAGEITKPEETPAEGETR